MEPFVMFSFNFIKGLTMPKKIKLNLEDLNIESFISGKDEQLKAGAVTFYTGDGPVVLSCLAGLSVRCKSTSGEPEGDGG